MLGAVCEQTVTGIAIEAEVERDKVEEVASRLVYTSKLRFGFDAEWMRNGCF